MTLQSILNEIQNYRDKNPGKECATLVTEDMINQLGNHDGYRIYLGLKQGHSTFYVVAADKDATGQYNDVGVPTDASSSDMLLDTQLLSNVEIVKALPCPDWCSRTGILR